MTSPKYLMLWATVLASLVPVMFDASPGEITTVAGTGVAGFSGDGGDASLAKLDAPHGLALDAEGNLYISDSDNGRVRRVDVDTGYITTIAGPGLSAYHVDDVPATQANLDGPTGLAFDAAGNLFISETIDDRIRRVDADTGIITTVAGTGDHGFDGDGELATTARFAYPAGLAVDDDGNLFIADQNNHRIRRIDAVSGIITTVAGDGVSGYDGDDILATTAHLSYPADVAVDAKGNLFIADALGHRIRRVDGVTRIITTVAGTGVAGFSGDGAAATLAQLNVPSAVEIDAAGGLIITDAANNRLRRVHPVTGVITTIAGNGSDGVAGDEGPPLDAAIGWPGALAVGGDGAVYAAQTDLNRVRWILAVDTEGDGFPNLVDNFPSVFSRCRTSQATVIGTSGSDNPLDGTTGPDVIMGFGGSDQINGLGGDDLICAGNGADTVFGGDGKDKIYGEGGNDTIDGGFQSDRLYGGDGDDTIDGGPGTRDRLYGGDGVDVLDAGSGNDDRCTLGETYSHCEIVF